MFLIRVGRKRKLHKMSRSEQKPCLFFGGGCRSGPVVAFTCLAALLAHIAGEGNNSTNAFLAPAGALPSSSLYSEPSASGARPERS